MYLRHLLLLLSTRRIRTFQSPCKTLLITFLVRPKSGPSSVPCHLQISNHRYYATSINGGGDSKDDKDTTIESKGKKENKGQGDPERPYFSPEEEKDKEDGPLDEELIAPTNCCRSGCTNCVWVEYVEKLTERYLNPDLSRERILAELETIDDQSIKAFIKLELKSKGLI